MMVDEYAYQKVCEERDALAARIAELERQLTAVQAKLGRLQDSPEQRARDQMILDIIRAKRDAGFDREVAFFKDVWPVALAALKRERESAP